MYAGLIALINEKLNSPVGYLNPTLYKLAAATKGKNVFRDIKDGATNATSGAPGYSSVNGWDACTGLGVVDGSELLKSLGAEK